MDAETNHYLDLIKPDNFNVDAYNQFNQQYAKKQIE